MRDHDVSVIARFETDGTVTPLYMTLGDGTQLAIDRVLDVCRAASRKQGGCGIRYRCRVQGREVILFRDEERWFYE
jgi:hypothetical protein